MAKKMASDVKARRLNLKGYHRHMILCTGPKCCTQEEGLNVWQYLKRRLKEIEPDREHATIYRTKAGCLRVCCDGPIAVVYPEGTWYRLVDIEACEKIIQSHLRDGVPVNEFLLEQNDEVAKPPSGG